MSKEIYLPEDEPNIVARMGDYLYTLDYENVGLHPVSCFCCGHGRQLSSNPSQLVYVWLLSCGQEALSKEILLPNDEPDIVARMVDLLYSQDYDDREAAGSALTSPTTSRGSPKPAFGSASSTAVVVPFGSRSTSMCPTRSTSTTSTFSGSVGNDR
jgi:hypothetical protein